MRKGGAQTARFRVKKGAYAIEAHAIVSGSDVVLHLGGGDHPHVGAISLATYVEATHGVTLRSLTAGHHKESKLTEHIAKFTAEELQCTAAVSAGIHYDCLGSEGIDAILSLADEAGRRTVAWIQGKEKGS